MKIFIDSSVFLKLMLMEPEASKAREVLEAVERGEVVGYLTPLVLEEVTFKSIYAYVSAVLNTRNIWKVKDAMRYDEEIRRQAFGVVKKIGDYIGYLALKGLRIESLTHRDWESSLKYVRKYGLLPADALHLSVALRVKANAIASFDEDFRAVSEVKVIP